MHKYLVLFTIPNPFSARICMLMDKVARVTGINPPHVKLPPHMTFHRPIAGLDGQVLENCIRSATRHMRQTRITLNSLYPLGKQYIVLPVQATRSVAALWVGIGDLLSRLPEYEHGGYDSDNVLHVTVASQISPVFDRSWSAIQEIKFNPMTIPLREIVLCRKPLTEGRWEKVASFPIPL